MKILYSYRSQEEKNKVEKLFAGEEIIFHEGSLQNGEWDGAGVEILCVFVDSNIGKAEFDRLPDLKFVATKSTGFDYVDHKEAKARGILVSNVPTYGEHTVAEFAIALLLAVSRNILKAYDKVQKGDFNPDGLEGFDLYGKTLGVLGTGRIGKNVSRIAKGLGMNLIGFDLYPDESFAQEVGMKYMSMDEVLANTDVLTLHLPKNESTEGILTKEKIALMKKGSILINTARGSLIDTEALVWGLQEGIIAGAGLDVLSEEGDLDDEMHLLNSAHPKEEALKTLLLNHYLIDHPKVLITPHTAFNTKEAVERILETTLENIQKYISGTPQNLV